MVAIHEAAHAVVAIRAGFPVRYVTLTARASGRLAHVMMRDRDREREYCTWDGMAVSAAGPVAHDIASDCRDRVFVTAGATTDLAHMLDEAQFTRSALREGASPERGLPRTATVRQIAAEAWADTYRRVTADWGAILAVADALLHSRSAVAASTIRTLIDGATFAELPRHAHHAEMFWPPRFMERGYWMHERAAGGAR